MKPFQMLPVPELQGGAALHSGSFDIEAIAAEIPPDVPPVPLSGTEIAGVAYDIALFPERRDEIRRHYKLSGEQWVQMTQTPAYQASAKHAAAALKNDPNLAARMVARAGMADAVLVALQLAKSSLVEPKDRLKALDSLMRLTQVDDTGVGMENRKAAKGSGVGGGGITINFGSVVGQALKSVIIERDDE